jgi:hypothetical protein
MEALGGGLELRGQQDLVDLSGSSLGNAKLELVVTSGRRP